MQTCQISWNWAGCLSNKTWTETCANLLTRHWIVKNSLYISPWRCVFISLGKLFHSLVAANINARSPSVVLRKMKHLAPFHARKQLAWQLAKLVQTYSQGTESWKIASISPLGGVCSPAHFVILINTQFSYTMVHHNFHKWTPHHNTTFTPQLSQAKVAIHLQE